MPMVTIEPSSAARAARATALRRIAGLEDDVIGLEGGEDGVRVVMGEVDRGQAERRAGLPRDGLDDDVIVVYRRQLAGDLRRVGGIDGDEKALRLDQRREAGGRLL